MTGTELSSVSPSLLSGTLLNSRIVTRGKSLREKRLLNIINSTDLGSKWKRSHCCTPEGVCLASTTSLCSIITLGVGVISG